MKQYKVEITEAALRDMEQIYSHIVQVLLSPENAMGQYNRIAEEILKLDGMPERFPLVDAAFCRTVGMRRMLVDNYSVFYIIRGETVIVTDVLYSASNLEERLKGME